ncbi:transcriptional regulator, MerR family [Beutenbergia cavernae DSM 12333]|uniref:Transcriptional regulator, MerR family n=1 Tax=Beutenbergia cavernae (strain ATCC BAA-8 / DSM 12333 / CCUG 43141 / JCM 11478 / NBRC 16432 / NCIMB 13614 / HKI 0122) TaxID=471853 RepID=C5BVP2_BEUC1|nr:MerR family transcriptional regulator [Beutenbergia cavernae]ACQ78482.1 transcriptional regulator, MerR family [Beutenbergia cavernae DSM 12333]
MDWSIQEVARRSGTTSRTLRHYGDLGLLAPSGTGPGGIRYYDDDALVRLQRILLLRELGLSLAAIREVLDGERDATQALRTHLELLELERSALDRRIASVRTTIDKREGGERLMAQEVFDGFDHTQYEEEVTRRWGRDAYASGDRWWRGLSTDERAEWKARVDALSHDWIAAARSGVAPDSAEAQALARRHVEWLTGTPGTPTATPGGDAKGYVVGLAEMYVADPRFGANYTADDVPHGAEFVRDALTAYAEREL